MCVCLLHFGDLSSYFTCFQLKLRTLDLGRNFVSEIENIAHLRSLEELWVRRFHASLLSNSHRILLLSDKRQQDSEPPRA